MRTIIIGEDFLEFQRSVAEEEVDFQMYLDIIELIAAKASSLQEVQKQGFSS